MGADRISRVRLLEGKVVTVTTAHDPQLCKATLVSAPRGRASTYWLEVDGEDVFVPAAEVVSVRPAMHHPNPDQPSSHLVAAA